MFVGVAITMPSVAMCENGDCPNPATVTLYKEGRVAEVCRAHQYIYKHLGWEENK